MSENASTPPPMESERDAARMWSAREVLAAAPVLFGLFHLYEQWAAFRGRDAYVARMSLTSHGMWALILEIALGVAPLLLWLGLDVKLRAMGPSEPDALRFAAAEDPTLAERLGTIARVAGFVLLAFLIAHALWLWAPKLVGADDPILSWRRLQDELGAWPWMVAHAVGLTAFAVHLAVTPVRLAIAFDLALEPATRRGLRLSGVIVAVGVLYLFAELAGLHASGLGSLLL